jgi:hypothetical protein
MLAQAKLLLQLCVRATKARMHMFILRSYYMTPGIDTFILPAYGPLRGIFSSISGEIHDNGNKEASAQSSSSSSGAGNAIPSGNQSAAQRDAPCRG